MHTLARQGRNARGYDTSQEPMDTPPFDPLVLTPHTYIRADLGFTLNGSNYSQITCQASGRTWSQATAANQPAQTIASELQNVTVMRGDGINDQLISDSAPSVWRFLHDGTGVEAYATIVPRAVFGALCAAWGTASADPLEVGAFRGYANNIPTDYTEYFTVNGTGLPRVISSEQTPYVTENIGAILGNAYSEASAPDFRQTVNDTIAANANRSGAPAAGVDPTRTLRLLSTGVLYFFNGDLAELIIWNRILTSTERAQYSAYTLNRYGKPIAT